MNQPRTIRVAAAELVEETMAYRTGRIRGINVGCGTSIVSAQGWINLDNSPTLLVSKTPLRYLWPSLPRWPRAVRFCHIGRLPFPDQSVQVVYSSHFLEHLPPTKATQYLRDAYRVLVPGGIIRTVVPDIGILAMDYVQDRNTADEFVERLRLVPPGDSGFYGFVRRILRQGNYHHWMYDYESLQERLQAVGFVAIYKRDYLQSDIPEISQLDIESYKSESLYLEARKPGG